MIQSNMNYEASTRTGPPGDPPSLSVFIGLSWPIVIFTNAFVVFTISRKSSLQSVVNYFIMNLAAGNSMIGLILMPMMITESIHPLLISTGFLCNIMIAASFIVILMTILTVFTLSVAHVILIEHPLSYGKYLSTCRLMTGVCVMWVVSIVFSSLCITVMKEHDATRCRYHLIVDVSALHLVVSGIILMPALVSLLINVWLLLVVKRSLKKVATYRESVSEASAGSRENVRRSSCPDQNRIYSVFDSHRRDTNLRVDDVRRDSSESTRRHSDSPTHRVVSVQNPPITYQVIMPTVVSIIVELVCWIPLTIGATLRISKMYATDTEIDVIDWTGCMALLCSMMIPCIHAIHSRVFRKEVWNFFTRKHPEPTARETEEDETNSVHEHP